MKWPIIFLLFFTAQAHAQLRAKYIPGTTPYDSVIVPSGVLVNNIGKRYLVQGDTNIATVPGMNLKEDKSNKVTTLSGANNNTYPTTLAVKNAMGGWMTVIGDSNKTIVITHDDGSAWMSADFTDNDKQTLFYANDSLRISNGNAVGIHPRELLFTSTGTNATTYTLPSTPIANKYIVVTLNNAFVDAADWAKSGNNISFSFPIETTDMIHIYYKSN